MDLFLSLLHFGSVEVAQILTATIASRGLAHKKKKKQTEMVENEECAIVAGANKIDTKGAQNFHQHLIPLTSITS